MWMIGVRVNKPDATGIRKGRIQPLSHHPRNHRTRHLALKRDQCAIVRPSLRFRLFAHLRVENQILAQLSKRIGAYQVFRYPLPDKPAYAAAVLFPLGCRRSPTDIGDMGGSRAACPYRKAQEGSALPYRSLSFTCWAIALTVRAICRISSSVGGTTSAPRAAAFSR